MLQFAALHLGQAFLDLVGKPLILVEEPLDRFMHQGFGVATRESRLAV